jgi:hypothetical protein
MNKIKLCDRCKINESETETEEGFYLCNGCDSIRLNCINEPTEERTIKDFIKEVNIRGCKK